MILALKTDGPDTELYLVTLGGHVEHELRWESRRELADKLLGKILGLLERSGLKPADLEAIIVFSGPGSFTSLRIGHTVANALADSLGIPVAGVMGNDWVMQGCRATAQKPTGPALPHYGAEAHITKPKS